MTGPRSLARRGYVGGLIGSLLGLTVALPACSLYVPDEDVPLSDVIQLTADNPDTDGPAEEPEIDYLADGQQTVNLIVDVDVETSTSKDIVITTSDGIVNFSVAPDDPAARTKIVRVAPGGEGQNSTRKTITVPMVVGRTPGNVFVTAAVAGIQTQLTLSLSPAPVEIVVLQTSVTALALDGVSRADLSATLLREIGQVSHGTRVSWAVCCAGDGQSLSACSGRTPLRVPALSELQTGETIAMTAVSERMTAAEFGGDPDPIDVWVVAEPVIENGDAAQCAGVIADVDAVRLQVAPSL